ncbi:MAG: PEGA domain-containing protein [Acidobacteriia bacterium]|nr:PEGA domain-containing protein [Terriglobia bacterium]
MKTQASIALVALAVSVCLMSPAVPRAEEPPPPTPARPSSPLDAIRDDLLALRFESALAAIDAMLRDPALPASTRLDALVLRSQAHAASGALDAAEQDYREVLDLDPAFEPDPAVASRKAIARFEKARADRVGMLRIDLDPSDATVLVDGRPARRLADGTLPALAGSRTLRLERKGFDPLERTIDVQPGHETPFVVRLVPNVRSIVVRTEPDGVLVSVDDQPSGETARPKSGAPDAPAQLEIDDLAPGEHAITLRKPCYRTVRHRRMITVDLMDHAPLAIETVALDPVRSRLKLMGSIEGGEVRVDGNPAGTLPIEPLELCPGPRDVEVRAGGRVVWWARVELPEEGGLEVEVRPRPNLARVVAEWPRALSPFAESFSAAPPLPLPPGADLSSTHGWEAVQLPGGTDLAVTVTPAPGGGPADRGALYSPILRTVERIEGTLPDPSRPAWLESSTGMKLADSSVWGKAVVVEVAPGGPAAAANISVGDRVLAVGSSAVDGSRQAAAALRDAAPGSEIEVHVAGPQGAPRAVRVRTAPTPVIPVRHDGARSPAVVAAWAAADGAVAGGAAPSALANLALLLSGAGRHDLAADVLRRIPWGERKGVGAGTGAYLLGRELEFQGLEADARTAFLRARASLSTAPDDDGLEVAPAAADHLADLGVAPEPAAQPTGR